MVIVIKIVSYNKGELRYQDDVGASNSSSSMQVFFAEIVFDGLQPIFLRVSFNTDGGWSILGERYMSPDIRRRIYAASVSLE